MLEQLGLSPYFDFVCGEEPGIKRKPAPDVLQKIMKQAGAVPERTLMVGDTDVDIECARSAGVRVAVVSYGQHSADHLSKAMPDYMINSMPELLEIIGS